MAKQPLYRTGANGSVNDYHHDYFYLQGRADTNETNLNALITRVNNLAAVAGSAARGQVSKSAIVSAAAPAAVVTTAGGSTSVTVTTPGGFTVNGGNSYVGGTLAFAFVTTALVLKGDNAGGIAAATPSPSDATGDYVVPTDTRLNHSITGETPSGTINSINTVFTLANTPLAGSVAVYLGATATTLYRVAPSAYSVTTNTITFSVAPSTGSVMVCDYRD